MNNLFQNTKSVFKQAYLKVRADDVVHEALMEVLPQLKTALEAQTVVLSLKQQHTGYHISICSKDATIITAIKLHQMALEETIQKEFVDKKILQPHQSIKLSIYRR